MGIPYSYEWQYADTESNTIDRVVRAGTMSQWGVAIMIAKGPYPPGYHVPNGQNGGGYPPQGQQSDGTKPIRIQPPSSGDGQRFMFKSECTLTVVNNSSQVGQFLYGLGVSYPSETDRPMSPYLGVFHIINDYRKMAPITIPANGSVTMTTIRMDVLDPDFAAIANWPKWNMTPNSDNKLWPAISPTCVNPGKVDLQIKDVLALGYAIPY